MALEAGLGAASGLPAISDATILAGIMAVLVDLDHVELPPHRTPAGHSLPTAGFWIYLSVATALLLFPALAAAAALASVSAFVSHLGLDCLTRGGIFLWPARGSPREWLQPLPEGLLLYHGGGRYLWADEKDHQALSDGELAWPGWKMWRAKLPPAAIPGKLPGDAVVSSVGLLALVAAAAWG